MKKELIILLVLYSLSISVFRSVVFWDTAVYFENGKKFLTGQSSYFEIQRPPIFSLILGILGNEFVSRIIISIFYSLFIFLCYYFFRDYGENQAIFAAVLIATNPITSFWGTELISHSPANVFALAAVIFMFKKRDTLSGIALGMVFLTRYITSAVCFPIGIYLIYKKQYKRVLKIALTSAATIVPWLLFSYFSFGSPFASLLEAIQLSEWSPHIETLFYLKNVHVFLGGLIFAFPFAVKKFKNEKLKFSALWIIIGLIILSYFNYKDTRYTFMVIAPAAFIASVGIFEIKRYSKDLAVSLFLLILFSNAIMFSNLYNSYEKCSQENLRLLSNEAGTLISGGESIASNRWPLTAYFSGRKTIPFIVWRDSTKDYFAENNVGVALIVNSSQEDSVLLENMKSNGMETLKISSECLNVHLLDR